MRDRNIQRMVCTGCGWSGGRAAGGVALLAPCSKCGAGVEPVGAPYVEERVLAGCSGCSWWGEVRPARMGTPCKRCGQPVEPVVVATLESGQVLTPYWQACALPPTIPPAP